MFKILIAEDDRELRQLFAHVLTKNGYTVLGVSNGEEALAALEQSYYDLIISDIMMPKMDGYELVGSIRESGSSIPIMMITAKDAFDDMRLGFLSGSDDYMVKPINIGEMVLRVSALLRRAQMASERRQVIGGIAEELLLLSTKYSFHDDVAHWRENGKRYETRYDGPSYALALEELLEQSGVAILYDTLAVTPIMQGRRCKAVVVENKSGRRAYACGAVVDASGDAEVFSRIGVPCECAENNLAIWCYCTRGGEGHILERGGARELGLNLLTLGNIDKNAHSDVVRRPYFGSDAEEVNRFVLDGHRRLLDLAKEDADLVLASLPSMPQIRMARRIEGAYTLTEADLSAHFEDNIGATGDWRRPNPVYEIPYRTLYTPEVDNILAAGRCISATGVAWEVTRVIPPAAVMRHLPRRHYLSANCVKSCPPPALCWI